jgi:lipid-binding SYLF domain-containing protein
MSWLQAGIGRARGPDRSVDRQGQFIFGGSGGRAVLLARDGATGKWSGPAFFTMATASVGFQAGISVSENVTLVMTEKALNSLLANSVKAGADASVAAGPVGAGAKSDVVADLVTFSRARACTAASISTP